ncbi:MAG TPA: VOC family protein [Thermoanaerobaculia bacterium]|nr:VOC family protein [Thermoanaerobaculia bacterium]
MLATQKMAAFVGARDAAKAKAFYGDTLGLRLVSEDHGALVFDAGGTRLRVQAGVEVAAVKYTVLGWQVADIVAAVKELAQRGVKFEVFGGFRQDELGIWTAHDGTRVAWFKDPDGNILSLDQAP